MVDDPTRSTEVAALSSSRRLRSLRVKFRVPELAAIHAWLDSWSGLGVIVVAMRRHGYDVKAPPGSRRRSVMSRTADTSPWRSSRESDQASSSGFGGRAWLAH